MNLKGCDFMKKIIGILLIVVMGMSTLVGCRLFNGKDSTSENSKKISDNTSSENKDNDNKVDKSVDSKEKTVDKSVDNNSNSTSNKNKSNITKNSNNKSSLNELMGEIKKCAVEGKVINSNFKLGNSIDNVTDKLGKASSEAYVESAKGDYFTFNSKNLVFGCNKGEQIFEIRCLENNLNQLTIKTVENFFGKPAYNVTTKLNENIIGYKISTNFKILFVFDNKSHKLKHYSVLYPELTKNSMSGSKAREW